MVILIVDDNALIRQTIKAILDVPGILCVECSDGVTAVERYREVRPAWVLMDLMMPGVNGIQATKEIVAEYPDARIAIVTNFDDAEFRKAAKEAGACTYVLKEEMMKLKEICTAA